MFYIMKFFILIVIVASLFCGCALMTIQSDFTKPITQGKLITPGCKIESASGDFVIESGKSFEPPFQNESFENWSDGSPYWSISSYNEDLIGLVEEIQIYGARKVRVTVPEVKEKLYGLLWLGTVYETATGPASRSYQIQIPQSYVRAAMGGKVSVIYELVDFEYLDYEYETLVESSAPTWILWISDMPFGEEEGAQMMDLLSE